MKQAQDRVRNLVGAACIAAAACGADAAPGTGSEPEPEPAPGVGVGTGVGNEGLQFMPSSLDTAYGCLTMVNGIKTCAQYWTSMPSPDPFCSGKPAPGVCVPVTSSLKTICTTVTPNNGLTALTFIDVPAADACEAMLSAIDGTGTQCGEVRGFEHATLGC